MRKLLLITSAVLLFQLVHAQPGKGTMFIGGGISGNITNYPELNPSGDATSKAFGIAVSPQFGYFLNDKYAVGAYLNYGYSNNSSLSGSYLGTVSYTRTILNNYGGGLFVRYYKPLTDKFYFTLNNSLGYNYTYLKQEGKSTSILSGVPQVYDLHWMSKSNNYGLGISPGFEYFVNPHLNLRASFGSLNFGYTTQQYDYYRPDENTFNVNFDLNQYTLQFGLNYFF